VEGEKKTEDSIPISTVNVMGLPSANQYRVGTQPAKSDNLTRFRSVCLVEADGIDDEWEEADETSKRSTCLFVLDVDQPRLRNVKVSRKGRDCTGCALSTGFDVEDSPSFSRCCICCCCCSNADVVVDE
jgi:hypothetical protein